MQRRCICTCMQLQASIKQIGRIINKVMRSDTTKKSQRKKVQVYDSIAPAVPINNNMRKVAPTKTLTKTVQRRVSVLNKVFMKYITDLMTTGEVAPELIGKGIEVTHVNVAPDYSVINVFWIAEKEQDDNKHLEQILNKAGGHLQHELSQLHVIGMVPPVNFVKNKRFNTVRQVESRLSSVDFGEDFVPSSYIHHTTTPILKTTLSSDLRAKISKLEHENDEVDENYEISVPEMRQNVLGFDHFAVMQKIKDSIGKVKQVADETVITSPRMLNDQERSSEISRFLSDGEQNNIFNSFIKKRALIEKRRIKRGKKIMEKNELRKSKDWYEDSDCDEDDDNISNKYEYVKQYEE